MIGERYRLEEQVGVGATSIVWRATDTLLDRQVAIKRLAPALASDEKARERFLRGASAAASLQHPGIVSVYDVGEDEDGPWLVMELIGGRTLAERLAEDGPLPAAEVMQVVGEIAAALDHAHEQGVVHRDIKPSNLIVESDGRVRVTDFGLARPVGESATVTTTGEVVGTAAYMAPEIVAGEPASAASDIYSLGAVAYELVSGRRPFTGDSTLALLEAIRTQEPVPLTGVVSPEMAVAIGRAMARNPGERHETAGRFAVALAEGSTLVLPAAPADPVSVVAAPVPADGSAEGRAGRGRGPWVVIALGLAVVILVTLLVALSTGPGGEPGSTTTAAPTTTTLATTTTEPTTTTTAPLETPKQVAAAIHDTLDQMRPPVFKPADIRDIAKTVDEVIEAWGEGRPDRVADRLDRAFELADDLPESEEKEELITLLERLEELVEA